MFSYRVSPQQLSGLSVVITGCDTGFGHDTALALLSKNMNVYAGCYTMQGIESLEAKAANNKHKYRGNLLTLLLDVSNSESVNAFAASVLACIPEGLYALINNAGIVQTGLFEVLPLDKHKQVFEVNYFGVLRMMRAFAPSVRLFSANRANNSVSKHRIPRPRIINIASIAARFPLPTAAEYSASKHACKALTEVARIELSQFSILVTLVEPYFAKTPIVHDRSISQDIDYKNASDEVQSAYGRVSQQSRSAQTSKIIESSLTMDPEQVVSVISKTVELYNLKNEYFVGMACYLLLLLNMIVPWWIVDFFTIKNFIELSAVKKHKYN